MSPELALFMEKYPLAAVARDNFIAPALTGTHQGGLVHTARADGLHQPLHFRIVPHTKGMILERVEVGEVAPFPLLPDRKISDKMERKGELNNGN